MTPSLQRQALVIEDNAEIAQLIRLHLEDLGLIVQWEADGIAGFEHAQTGSFDLIVLDLMLPGMGGLDVLRKLRADSRGYTPILMLTAKASEIDRVVGLELGADDYLGKPFSIPELQARARALLRRAERMRLPSTAGFEHAQTGSFDLIVLDLMLPGMGGLDVLRKLRADSRGYTPILMLTAKASEIDRVVGLELGADDYLGKPFSIPELQARARALLRRAERMRLPSTTGATVDVLQVDGLSVDLTRREVRLRGALITLTAKEFDLLLHFVQTPGRVHSRAQLLDAVWGTTLESYEHNVNTHINRLRAKIEADPANPHYILTVRGVGYRFADAV